MQKFESIVKRMLKNLPKGNEIDDHAYARGKVEGKKEVLEELLEQMRLNIHTGGCPCYYKKEEI